MKKPRILITTSNVSSSVLESVTGDTDLIYSDRVSAQVVIAAGGIPVYMPSLSTLSQADLEIYLEGVDGVLLTGADTEANPIYYGEKITHQKGRIDDERDQVDLALIKLAYQKKLPMLGICKGMQLINVAFGGTLYQDVTAQHDSNVTHALRGKRTKVTHEAQLAENSLLKRVFGRQKLRLNGGHDQAIKKLAKELRATAVAEDKIVEAFEGKNYPFLLGVQFHAELKTDEPKILEIFKAFVNAAKS